MYKIVQVHPDLRLTKPENPAWKHELKYCGKHRIQYCATVIMCSNCHCILMYIVSNSPHKPSCTVPWDLSWFLTFPHICMVQICKWNSQMDTCKTKSYQILWVTWVPSFKQLSLEVEIVSKTASRENINDSSTPWIHQNHRRRRGSVTRFHLGLRNGVHDIPLEAPLENLGSRRTL